MQQPGHASTPIFLRAGAWAKYSSIISKGKQILSKFGGRGKGNFQVGGRVKILGAEANTSFSSTLQELVAVYVEVLLLILLTNAKP